MNKINNHISTQQNGFQQDSFWTLQVISNTSFRETRSLSEHPVFCA